MSQSSPEETKHFGLPKYLLVSILTHSDRNILRIFLIS